MPQAEQAVLDPTKTWAEKTLKHDRQLTCCRFSPCGKFLAAGGLDNLVHRWELETEKKTTLSGHTSWISGLAFHPDGKRLYSLDLHGNLLCWQYPDEAPKPLWSVKQTHGKRWAKAIVASPTGKHLLTGGYDGAIRLWSPDSGKLFKEFPGHKGDVFSVAFAPDGKSVVSGDLFGTVRHWDLASGKLIRKLDASPLHTRKEDYLADVGGVRGMAFDPSGSQLACSGLKEIEGNTFLPGDPTVIIFDWATGKAKPELHLKNKGEINGFINGVRYLADGTLAGYAEGANQGALWFWKPDQVETFHSLPGPNGFDLDLHPDGLRLAVPMFEGIGHTGNGRRAKTPAEYMPNAGQVRIFNLTSPPQKVAT